MNTLVDFPINSLVLEDDSGMKNYRLFATINHEGSMQNSGHYTAHCRKSTAASEDE
jgi:uncharacterized UBP type Zn finger protein